MIKRAVIRAPARGYVDGRFIGEEKESADALGKTRGKGGAGRRGKAHSDSVLSGDNIGNTTAKRRTRGAAGSGASGGKGRTPGVGAGGGRTRSAGGASQVARTEISIRPSMALIFSSKSVAFSVSKRLRTIAKVGATVLKRTGRAGLRRITCSTMFLWAIKFLRLIG